MPRGNPQDDVTSIEAVTPARRKRRRCMTLQRALKQAHKAGVSVAGATLNPDGSVELQFSEVHTRNEWDDLK